MREQFLPSNQFYLHILSSPQLASKSADRHSYKYFCIRKCELPPRFCIGIYLPSMASKQCAKFHRFSNFLALFKLMDFAKRPWLSQYYCTANLLYNVLDFPLRYLEWKTWKFLALLILSLFLTTNFTRTTRLKLVKK